MQGKSIIAILGGSFNPPLISHIKLAQELIRTKRADKVIFVPVNSKYDKRGLISNDDRYNMLKIICQANKYFDVCRLEIDSDRPLYTIETLNKMKEIHVNSELIFVLGSDNLKEFNTWKDPEQILEKFKIIVFQRNNDDVGKIILENDLLRKYKDSFIQIDMHIDLSSTYVRELIKEGKEYKQFVIEEVHKYIEENKLYKIGG